MSDADDRILVVLQLGSTMVRVGLSGDDAPRRCLTHVINGRNPVHEGVLVNPDDFVTIVRGSVGEDLDCEKETRGILVCDPPTNTQDSRKAMAKVLFDIFHFPAVLFYTRTALCALSTCRTNAIVVELGDEHTYVAPVIECSMVRAGLQIGPIAGRQISAWLLEKLRTYNPGLSISEATLGFNEIGGIKRQCKTASSKIAFEATQEDAVRLEAAVREKQKKASEKDSAAVSSNASDASPTKDYVLCGTVKSEASDTKVHELTLPPEEVLSFAPETLFQPHLLDASLENKATCGGLAQLVINAINAIPNPSQELLQHMYQNVVLAGRGSMFPGLAKRLEGELKEFAFTAHGIETVAIVEDAARSSAAWVGASILSSMRDTTANGFVTKAHWDTYGPAIFDTWSTE